MRLQIFWLKLTPSPLLENGEQLRSGKLGHGTVHVSDQLGGELEGVIETKR